MRIEREPTWVDKTVYVVLEVMGVVIAFGSVVLIDWMMSR